MPCGGIIPVKGSFVEDLEKRLPPKVAPNCWQCQKNDPPPDHFIIEWDDYIHRDCITPFLETEEGQIVLAHKHDILIRNGDGTIEAIYPHP